MASLADRIFYLLQCLLPTRLLTTAADRLARSETPAIRDRLIRFIAARFSITLDDAEIKDFDQFPSFNAFFTRALAPDARPLAPEPDLVCPVDGTVSQLGAIRDGDVFQAKGRSFTTTELLGGHQDLAGRFGGGEFATIYLAPHNYHRIHMPLTAHATELVYVPGRLFSVNPATVRAAPRLFARNERLAVIFDSEIGPFAMVLVGALLVSGLETVLTGPVTPPHGGNPWRRSLAEPVRLERGAELGRFNYGSTVIVLAGAGAIRWNAALAPEFEVRMGSLMAHPEA